MKRRAKTAGVAGVLVAMGGAEMYDAQRDRRQLEEIGRMAASLDAFVTEWEAVQGLAPPEVLRTQIVTWDRCASLATWCCVHGPETEPEDYESLVLACASMDCDGTGASDGVTDLRDWACLTAE